MNKYTSALAMLAMFTGVYSASICAEEPAQQDAATDYNQSDFKTLEDRFSYAYGADLAAKFQEQEIELNIDLLAEAMRAVLTGGEMKMPDGEIIATLELYQEIHTKRVEERRAVVGAENKKVGDAFLAENAKKDGVVVTESGLQYKVLTPGTGDYMPNEEDEVTVHYRGTFLDGTEFDSTYTRNQPYNAKVRQLILGWTEALQLMTKGAKWALYIPADLAYGENGSGDDIGPNAVLLFEVELLEIEKDEVRE